MTLDSTARTTQGNKCLSTEVRAIEGALKEHQLPNDYVTLLLDGIELTWGDADLFQWSTCCLLSARVCSVAGWMCCARDVHSRDVHAICTRRAFNLTQRARRVDAMPRMLHVICDTTLDAAILSARLETLSNALCNALCDALCDALCETRETLESLTRDTT